MSARSSRVFAGTRSELYVTSECVEHGSGVNKGMYLRPIGFSSRKQRAVLNGSRKVRLTLLLFS